MTSPGTKEDRATLERFELLSDETPVTDQEADDLLGEVGLDPKASLVRLFGKLEAVEDTARQAKFARAEIARLEEVKSLEAPRAKRPREANLATLSALRQKYPELSASFRNFERVTDDELDEIVAEAEALIANGKR